MKYVGSMVKTLLESLTRRFAGLLDLLQIPIGPHFLLSNDFRCMVYLMAAALEPSFGFSWLYEDHPGSPETKERVKQMILGMYIIALMHLSIIILA